MSAMLTLLTWLNRGRRFSGWLWVVSGIALGWVLAEWLL